MLALTGTSPRRCAVRVGVTVTVSKRPAIESTMSTSRFTGTDCVYSANPPARTISVRSPAGGIVNVNRPSGPVTVCCSRPPEPTTSTDAPDTAPPAGSLTMPETADWAPAAVHRARTRTNARVVRMTANLSSDQAGIPVPNGRAVACTNGY